MARNRRKPRPRILMACGHNADARLKHGQPCCSRCLGLTPKALKLAPLAALKEARGDA